MEYTVYDLNQDEYTVEADQIEFDGDMVIFRKHGTIEAMFQLSKIIGFCHEDENE